MSSPEQASDVVIVGGGIMGSSAALFLRHRGRSVTLLESALIGQQASGVNFGHVRRQGRPMSQLPLAHRSRPLWQSMKELVGEDVEYVESGNVRVCYRDRPEHVGKLEEYAVAAREAGLELELLTGNALRSRFPFLGPDVLAGSCSPGDGQANPRLVAPAIARAARRAGARIHENTRIVHAEKAGDDFRVTSEDGRLFRAPILLITAGAWGNALAEQFGDTTPLVAEGPTMAVTEPVPYSIIPCVGVSSPVQAESAYFRQIPRGNIIMGGGARATAYPDRYRVYVDPRNTLRNLRQIRRLAPALGRLNIIRVWSGIEGYLPDDLPVMCASDRVSGLFYAYGFSGQGFQLGPGVGEVMAELIDTGATNTPLHGFEMSRFRSGGSGRSQT